MKYLLGQKNASDPLEPQLKALVSQLVGWFAWEKSHMQYSQGFFLCPGGQLVQQLPVHLWTFLFFKSRGIAGDVIPCFFFSSKSVWVTKELLESYLYAGKGKRLPQTWRKHRLLSPSGFRLKEIQMSEYDAATYERFSGAVQRQVHALRVILDNLQVAFPQTYTRAAEESYLRPEQ